LRSGVTDDVARLPIGAPLLACAGLDVFYGRVQTLHGVDFQLLENEIVALLGVNGAGKSTLLKAISGILPPAAGQITFRDERIEGLPSHEIVARGIVQVPGGRGTLPGLTIEENLKLGGFVFRRDKKRWREEIDRVIALFPWLGDRLGDMSGSLSGGQQQMLLLARAFVSRPSLIMIDELSLGLAPIIVGQLLGIVRKMNREGVSVVIVEQHVDLALNIADRAYFMERGEVRFSGPAAELRGRNDLLRSVFLAGAAEANL